MSDELKTKIEITADAASAIAALETVTSKQGALRDAAGRFAASANAGAQGYDKAVAQNVVSTDGLKRALEALGLLYAANKAVGFAQESVAAFNESEKEAAKLTAVLASTGHAAGQTRASIGSLVDELSSLSGVDDEVISGMESVLLTFRNIKGDAVKEASTAVLDLSTVMGSDLKGAALQVGKALNDPVEGVTALRRAGVSFTDSQLDQIKVLTESGRLYEAQKIVLKELNEEFGGAAAAAGATFGGQVNALTVKMGNLNESVGGVIATGLQPLVAELNAAMSSSEFTTNAVELATSAMQGLTYAVSVGAQTLNLFVSAGKIFAAAEGEYMGRAAAYALDSFADMTGAAATYLETMAKIPVVGRAYVGAAESVRGLSNDLKTSAADWRAVAGDNRNVLNKAVNDYTKNALDIEAMTDKVMAKLGGAQSAAVEAQIKESLAVVKDAGKMTQQVFEETYQKQREKLIAIFVAQAQNAKDTQALAEELEQNIRSLDRQRQQKQVEGESSVSDAQKQELEKRSKALESFNDRWLKATLDKSAYELQAVQKQYAEDIKLAGNNAALKLKALETYAAAAKKIDDDVVENLNKTRDAEVKKEADALGKLLDMREAYSLETSKILVKQDETELKALEEKIKRGAKTNVISLAEYQQYQTALKAVTEKRFLAQEAAQEKSLIRMLENEKLTDVEREKIIAEHIARVAAIKGEKTAEEITALEGVTAAVKDNTAQQDDFWKTFEFNSTTMAELSKTAWTGIRDHIKESIKTAKLDVQGLGEFFKNTLLEMVATAAANQIVLSIAGAGGLVVSSAGNALAGQVVGQGAGQAVGAYTSGVGTFGMGAAGGAAGSSGSFISGTAFAPGGWMGNVPSSGIGPSAPGVLYSPGQAGAAGSYTYVGVGAGATLGALGGRYVGQQVGGNRETTNAAGVAGGAAVGAYMAYGGSVGGPYGAIIGAIIGALMANYGPGEGGPQGYDKYTAGGIGEIRNHPHDALATDTGLLAQHMATGNAMGASLVLKQIDELNTATSLLDQEYFKNTAAGQQMAASWTALTTEGATLADTIDRTGLNSEKTAAGVEHMSASAQNFAMNAILGGQAGNELTASAVGIVASMNTAATATDKTLSSMASLADALYKAGENTWALSRAQGAAQVAQQMLNLSADLTYQQYQTLGQGAAELTKIEQRRAALMQELATGVDATRFADIQKELIGLETASEGYINSISNVGTATGDAATGTQDMGTGTDAAGTAAKNAVPHTDALGESYKSIGDYAKIAADQTRDLRLETEKLRSLLNGDPGNLGSPSSDGSSGNPNGRTRAGSFNPVNDSAFYRVASASSVIDMSGLTINIHAAPGQNPDEIADAVVRAIKDRSKRGEIIMFDRGLGKAI